MIIIVGAGLAVPEWDLIFNRVSFPMNFSPFMTPKRCSSLLVDITYKNEVVNFDDIEKK